MNEDFYIGYRKVAPPGLARFIRPVTGFFVVTAVVAAFVMGSAQQPPDDGHYEFGGGETFEGPIRTDPMLHMEIGGESGEDPAQRRSALLVGRGKHGAPSYVTGAAGKRVRLGAVRIERDGVLMLEVAGEQQMDVLGVAPAAASPAAASGTVTLTGELVDTKCYLGVMNPGRGKVHRGCAAECLRGGVPPGLLIRDTDGNSHVVVLQPLDSTATAVVPDWAARTVSASGTLERKDSLSVLTYRSIELADVPTAHSGRDSTSAEADEP